jgi:hypothetical protein
MGAPYTYSRKWTDITSLQDSFSVSWTPSIHGEKLICLGVTFNAKLTYVQNYTNQGPQRQHFCGAATESFALTGSFGTWQGPTIGTNWDMNIQENSSFSGVTTNLGKAEGIIQITAMADTTIPITVSVTGNLSGDPESNLAEGEMVVVITFNTQLPTAQHPSPPQNLSVKVG